MSDSSKTGGPSSSGSIFKRFQSSNGQPSAQPAVGGGMKRSSSMKQQLSSSSGPTSVLGSKGNLAGVKRQLLPSSKSKEGIWKQFMSGDRPSISSQQQQQPSSKSTTPPVSPGKQQTHATKPTSMGLRSPTPKPSSSLQPKRVSDSESDRPAKRQYTGAERAAGLPSGLGSSQMSNQARPRVSLKPRRSVACPSSTSSNNLATLGASTGSAQHCQQAQRMSLAPPFLASSASLLSFSPSKLGLTKPREFTFSSSVSSRTLPTVTERPTRPLQVSQAAPKQLLAPSPISSNEHVPKHAGLSRSQTLRDGLLSDGFAASAPTQPYLSPSRLRDQEDGQRRTISPLQKSDMWRSDLMRRSLERPEEKDVPTERTSPYRLSTTSPTIFKTTSPHSQPQAIPAFNPSSPSRALLSFSQQSTSPQQTSRPPSSVPTILFTSMTTSSSSQASPKQAPFLLPPVRLASEVKEKKLSIPASSDFIGRDTAMLSSPLKRARSPEEEPAQPVRAVRQRKEGTMKRSASAGTITRSISTRAVTRRASRAVSDNVSAGSASSVSKPESVPSMKRSQTQAFPATKQTTLAFQAAQAATQPATWAISPSPPAPKAASQSDAIEELSEENSASTVDMDTSIMSAHGHESLSNLNALLSKMSIPRRSSGIMSNRRSSLAPSGGTMNLLDERAEMEEEILAVPTSEEATTGSAQPLQRHVPRYAAATASSSSRYAGSYSDSTVPLKSSTSSLGLGRPAPATSNRRSSVGVPGARKGSLLPLASSSNAAKTTLKSSMSFSGGLSSLAGSMDVDEGAPKSPEQEARVAEELAKRARRGQILKDVVAFVDVKTAEGDEAGGVFVDILRNLGARVLARPTENTTHIVFKGGRPATIHRYRAFTRDPKPFLVGVGWIVSCRELDERVPEKGYLINPDAVEGVLLETSATNANKGNRRKSLEPRMLLAPPGQQQQQQGVAKNIFGALRDPNNNQELDRARRRSLQFAPRIGSPLKQRVFNAFEEDEDGIEAD